MIFGRRCPICGERAKQLDRAAAAAHVGYCVCCVLCFVVVFCVGEQLLATIPVESQHRSRPFAMNFVHFQTKNVPPKSPKYKAASKLQSFLDFEAILTFRHSMVWAPLGVRNSKLLIN
jgi:hypothetical protein